MARAFPEPFRNAFPPGRCQRGGDASGTPRGGGGDTAFSGFDLGFLISCDPSKNSRDSLRRPPPPEGLPRLPGPPRPTPRVRPPASDPLRPTPPGVRPPPRREGLFWATRGERVEGGRAAGSGGGPGRAEQRPRAGRPGPGGSGGGSPTGGEAGESASGRRRPRPMPLQENIWAGGAKKAAPPLASRGGREGGRGIWGLNVSKI